MPTLTEPKNKPVTLTSPVAPAEVEQWESYVDKTFVKREGNPDRHVFKVIHICPQFTGVIATREKTDRFYVQKYSVTYAAGGVKNLTAIEEAGDPEAAFFIDAKKFAEQFRQE